MPSPQSGETRCYVMAWGEKPKGPAAGMFAAQLTMHQATRLQADLFAVQLAQWMGKEVRVAVFHGPCHCTADAITGAVQCGVALTPRGAKPHEPNLN